ncbi:hypothetical protein ACFHYQ_18990 [Sphaerimonospora cavernae]|uniref:Uncharacterized protein n=1 Tax=Sphaerimonospora cavernae TaxID=1740611 RepID=A0ABV6U7F3_9ACTN
MTAVVLIALPMQNDISSYLPVVSALLPMAYQISAEPKPDRPLPDQPTPDQSAPGEPTPDEPAAEDAGAADPREEDPILEDLAVEDAAADAVVEDAVVDEPGPGTVTQVAAALPGMNLAGTFTAKVVTWDASAAATRLGQQDAARHLAEAGLKWVSTGGCTDRRGSSCTSLESIRYGTLMRLIDLKRASDCDITVTGGTEVGHSTGRYSHGNGYKVDIAHNKCIDAYIKGKFRRQKSRGDGSALYRPPSDSVTPSAVYADERTHWDIFFP